VRPVNKQVRAFTQLNLLLIIVEKKSTYGNLNDGLC